MATVIKCSFCLAKVPADSKVCVYCGQPLETEQESPATPSYQPPVPKIPKGLAIPSDQPETILPAKNAYDYLSEGINAFKAKQLDDAEQAFLRALELQPDFPEVQNALGYLHFTTGDSENAYPLFRAAVRLSPTNPHFLFNLSAALFQLKRYEEGNTTAHQVLKLLPQHMGAQRLIEKHTALLEETEWSEAVYNRAATLFELQDFVQVIGLLEQLRERLPEHPQATFLLGRAYVRTGEIAKAQELLLRALQLASTPEVAHELAKVYMLQQNLAEAIKCLNAAITKAPENADLYYTLGLAHERQSHFLEALDAFEHTWQLVSGHHNALYKHAQMLALLGRKREALERLQLLLAHAPGHDIAKQLLRDLTENF